MKVIMTNEKIISLENLMSVERLVITESKHTKRGEPYYLFNSAIIIKYFGGDFERIDFNDFESRKEIDEKLTESMEKIFARLKDN